MAKKNQVTRKQRALELMVPIQNVTFRIMKTGKRVIGADTLRNGKQVVVDEDGRRHVLPAQIGVFVGQ